MNIGVDIDGVIVDADTQFRKYMKKLFKRDFPRSKVKCYKYEECFEFTEYEFETLYSLFSDEDLWMGMRPVNGAANALKILSKENNLIIITSRPLKVKEVTIKWLKKYNIPYNEIHFALDKKDQLADKLEYQFDYFLEDHPNFAIKLADLGMEVLLFSYPWNKSVNRHPKIRRVSGWDEALKIIK